MLRYNGWIPSFVLFNEIIACIFVHITLCYFGSLVMWLMPWFLCLWKSCVKFGSWGCYGSKAFPQAPSQQSLAIPRPSNSCARCSHTSSSFYSQYSAEQPYLHLSIIVVLIYTTLYLSLTLRFASCLLKICQRPWVGCCKMRPGLTVAGWFMC